MLVIILTTILVLTTLWFCPAFNSSIEHYAPAKGGPAKAPPKGPAMPKGGPPKGPAPPPAKGGAPGSLTPDTIISVPLGVLVQFLSKVGAGDVGG